MISTSTRQSNRMQRPASRSRCRPSRPLRPGGAENRAESRAESPPARSKMAAANVSGRTDAGTVPPIAFVFSPEFFDGSLDSPLPATSSHGEASGPRASHTALGDAPPLDPERETELFREMNYAKFLAGRVLQTDPDDSTDADRNAHVLALLAHSQTLRNEIVEANMRLVMALVKRYATASLPFDELLSDGIETLINAVEHFDYRRGFRFSTYAYRSIARALYQRVRFARRQQARQIEEPGEWAYVQDERSASSAQYERCWQRLRQRMLDMIDRLDDREQWIIRCRYAVGSVRQPHTLRRIAAGLGISTERVRQLELRAVAKLRAMTSEAELDDLIAAGMR